jgi:D-aminoacyl-tRNA deacylase
VRALLQRASRAEVRVDGLSVGAIQGGLLVMLGVACDDDESVAAAMADKVLGLRIFADSAGRTNLALSDVGGSILVVSQFTLYADASRGRRPSFMHAAGPQLGERLYESFCRSLEAAGARVERGRFGADMAVELVNDGPFTVWLDSAELGISPRAAS